MNIIKRDGSEVLFDPSKIYNAISGANKDAKDQATTTTKVMSPSMIQAVTDRVVSIIEEECDDDVTCTVEDVQDFVESELMKTGNYEIAKIYILYRQKRKEQRDAAENLMKSYNDLLFADAEGMDLKRDNANINTDAPMGIMLKLGTEGAKSYVDNYFLDPEMRDADKAGILHYHDKDFSMICFNCLPGDSNIRIKTSGKVKDIKFKDFDSWFSLFGSNIIDMSSTDLKTLSKDGKFTKVNKIMRRRHSDTIYRFILKNGGVFEATGDHQVLLVDGTVKNASSVDIGDEFPIAVYDHNVGGTKKEVSLLEYFKNDNNVVIRNSDYIRSCIRYGHKQEFYRILRKDFNGYYGTIYNKKFTVPEYYKIKHLLDIDERNIKLCTHKGHNYVPAVLELNEDLGKIVGYIVAEGYVDPYNIVFANNDEDIVNDFMSRMAAVFPDIGCTRVRKEESKTTANCDIVICFGGIFSKLFTGLLANMNKSGNIVLPEWMPQASIEYIGGFFSAEIDGDGSVFDIYNAKIGTASRAFAYQMADILRKINIGSIIRCSATRNQDIIVNGVPCTRNYDSYTVTIPGEHYDKLKEILHSYKVDRSSRKIDGERRNLHLGKVVGIEPIPYVGYVYDFETENHLFVADGILTHNCCQIDLLKLFHSGFSTGHGFLREPNSIRSASALACIAIQSNQNDMFKLNQSY